MSLKLDLLSREAKSLGFENIKSTIDKIAKVNLTLSEEMKSEIMKISHSLSTIINKNTHNKNVRLDVKIKKDSEIIKCDDVSIILDWSNDLLIELLWNDDKDEISAEIELAEEEVNENKKIAGKSKENKNNYVESIRYKNELNKKLDTIILLEEIIDEINNFRDKLISIINWAKKQTSDIVEVNTKNTEEIVEPIVTEKEEVIIDDIQETVWELDDKKDSSITSEIEKKWESFDIETLRLIKLNLKNKKTELPKQNSLYSEVRDFFKNESRITFYNLGLYKLSLWFSNNNILDLYNAKNIIWLLDVNTLCKFFIEWRLWNSNETMLSVLW